MTEFKVNPTYQKHQIKSLEKNLQEVRDSDIFFIFGDRAYIRGCRKLDSETIPLINLAIKLDKPFILCLDNSLPLNEQIYLRGLCPTKNTQVFSFDPNKYSGMELYKRMMNLLENAINKEVVKDPFVD